MSVVVENQAYCSRQSTTNAKVGDKKSTKKSRSYIQSCYSGEREVDLRSIKNSAENKCLKETNLHRRESVTQSELSTSNYRFVHAPVVAADTAPSAPEVHHDTSSSTIVPVQ